MSNELKTYTLQELYARPMEPISWLVEGLLAPGLYFLGGSPKVGKSWLALQLCLAVCRGESFLGFHTRKSEVLYLALEDGPQRLHARALHLTEEAPAGLYLCTHAHLIGHGLEQQLDQMLAEHPAVKLVVIGTLQKIREATSATPSYSIDYRDASALKAVADRNDICMVVVHHLRKQKDEDPFKQMSGTNGLNGASPTAFFLLLYIYCFFSEFQIIQLKTIITITAMVAIGANINAIIRATINTIITPTGPIPTKQHIKIATNAMANIVISIFICSIGYLDKRNLLL